MIGHRIKPIEGFDAVPMYTPLIYDAPTNSLDANNLRLRAESRGLRAESVIGEIRSFDIDFQGIEAKINITDSRVNHRHCAVMFRPSDRIDCESLVADYLLLALAACKER